MLLYFTDTYVDCSLKSSCDPSVCQDRGSTACGDGTAFANSKLNHSTATYIVGPTVQYSAGQLEDKSSFSVNRPIEALRCGTFKPRSSSQLTTSTSSANYQAESSPTAVQTPIKLRLTSKQCKLPKGHQGSKTPTTTSAAAPKQALTGSGFSGSGRVG